MSKLRLGNLSLPTLSSGGNGFLAPLESVQQAIVDYSAASTSQRVTEGLQQVFSLGQSSAFTQMSARVGLEQANGTTAITDAQTGEQIFRLPMMEVNGTPNRGETNALTTNDFKVKLSSRYFGSIVFDVMPSIEESQSAEYVEFTPVHHPGAILKYRRTAGREWGLSAKLIARNPTEARQNLDTINRIRGWVMPQYGERAEKNAAEGRVPGAPPPILTLSAYGNRVIGPVKCVLTSFNWTFSDDVDYLPTIDINLPDPNNERVPFPAIVTVSLRLKESWSPAEFSSFNLSAYIDGRLTGESGAFFAQRVERAQRNTAPSVARLPTSQETAIAGVNALRRTEIAISQAQAVTANDTAWAGRGSGTSNGNVVLDADMNSGLDPNEPTKR